MVYYTIIIPHYNIPHLLKRCLSSIPNREDVQIIVVDDCSSEGVQAELKKMEMQFHNVQFVYSEKNLGGGHARNVGLRYAKGKYVLFADADDFYHDNLNALLDDYSNEECDIVFFNADSLDSDTLGPAERDVRLQSSMGDVIKLRYLFTEPWCKIVKKDLIEKYNIKFDEILAINDVTFSYMVGYNAKDIKVDKRKAYCVTYRPDSISFTDSFEKELLRVEVMARKNRFLKDHQIPVFDRHLLWPITDSLKVGEWRSLQAFFRVTKSYGFSTSCLLFKIVEKSLRCRIRNIRGKYCQGK